jgi:hypothetical protein
MSCQTPYSVMFSSSHNIYTMCWLLVSNPVFHKISSEILNLQHLQYSEIADLRSKID